jgi:hypothetical protein
VPQENRNNAQARLNAKKAEANIERQGRANREAKAKVLAQTRRNAESKARATNREAREEKRNQAAKQMAIDFFTSKGINLQFPEVQKEIARAYKSGAFVELNKDDLDEIIFSNLTNSEKQARRIEQQMKRLEANSINGYIEIPNGALKEALIGNAIKNQYSNIDVPVGNGKGKKFTLQTFSDRLKARNIITVFDPVESKIKMFIGPKTVTPSVQSKPITVVQSTAPPKANIVPTERRSSFALNPVSTNVAPSQSLRSSALRVPEKSSGNTNLTPATSGASGAAKANLAASGQSLRLNTALPTEESSRTTNLAVATSVAPATSVASVAAKANLAASGQSLRLSALQVPEESSRTTSLTPATSVASGAAKAKLTPISVEQETTTNLERGNEVSASQVPAINLDPIPPVIKWTKVKNSTSGQDYYVNKNTGKSTRTMPTTDWSNATNNATNRVYYINNKTGESTWNDPTISLNTLTTAPVSVQALTETANLERGNEVSASQVPAINLDPIPPVIEWTQVKNSNSGKYYYVNKKTKKSTWTKPTTDWSNATNNATNRVYYINNKTGESTWNDPTISLNTLTAAPVSVQKEWTRYYDSNNKAFYYVNNNNTQETTWNEPVGQWNNAVNELSLNALNIGQSAASPVSLISTNMRSALGAQQVTAQSPGIPPPEQTLSSQSVPVITTASTTVPVQNTTLKPGPIKGVKRADSKLVSYGILLAYNSSDRFIRIDDPMFVKLIVNGLQDPNTKIHSGFIMKAGNRQSPADQLIFNVPTNASKNSKAAKASSILVNILEKAKRIIIKDKVNNFFMGPDDDDYFKILGKPKNIKALTQNNADNIIASLPSDKKHLVNSNNRLIGDLKIATEPTIRVVYNPDGSIDYVDEIDEPFDYSGMEQITNSKDSNITVMYRDSKGKIYTEFALPELYIARKPDEAVPVAGGTRGRKILRKSFQPTKTRRRR